MDRAFESMLKETEIRYILDLLKEPQDNELKDQDHTFVNITKKQEYYQQAKNTLEIQMAKLGLSDMYQSLMN